MVKNAAAFYAIGLWSAQNYYRGNNKRAACLQKRRENAMDKILETVPKLPVKAAEEDKRKIFRDAGVIFTDESEAVLAESPDPLGR